MLKSEIVINNRKYNVEIIKRNKEKSSDIVIATVTYIKSKVALEMTKAAIASIKKFTNVDYELWIVDNNSPEYFVKELTKIENVNFILNRTLPIPPLSFNENIFNLLWKLVKGDNIQLRYGAYANGLGLELIPYVFSHIFSYEPKYLFVMHNDILATKEGWLSYLISKINQEIKGVALYTVNIRYKTMHVSGLLFDFSLFNKLKMSFLPDYPRYSYDAGDLITIRLREHGYSYFICPNTYNNPSLITKIPENSPFRLHSVKAFDDNGNITFMHMGRGTPKAMKIYKKSGKTYPDQWLKFARNFLNLTW